MRILNFGSLNIDYTYRVDHFLQPGETKASKSLMINCGGKGLNQSIAAAKAGNNILHAGLLGRDGDMLRDKLCESNVDVSFLIRSEGLSGNAIIQVDDAGQNCILLFGGTNRALTHALIDDTLNQFDHKGLVLLQNETNLVGYMIEQAAARGLKVAFNAAPMEHGVLEYPLDRLDWLIINEVEGKQLACCNCEDDILPILSARYPHCGILLTLGKRGSVYHNSMGTWRAASYAVKAVDTTAAGDTFTGYFLYGMLNDFSPAEALRLATTASALCVQRTGASDAVPEMAEVRAAMASGQYPPLEIVEQLCSL
ncbi:MAG: ribokinase [Clostridia bacterium]